MKRPKRRGQAARYFGRIDDRDKHHGTVSGNSKTGVIKALREEMASFRTPELAMAHIRDNETDKVIYRVLKVFGKVKGFRAPLMIMFALFLGGCAGSRFDPRRYTVRDETGASWECRYVTYLQSGAIVCYTAPLSWKVRAPFIVLPSGRTYKVVPRA